MFRIRNVLQEFEAHLQPVPPESKTRGKSEWKKYTDQSQRLKVKTSGLNLPEGTPLEIMIDGQKIGEMTLQGKLARFERDSEKGEYVPQVEADQVLQVLFRGEVIAQGKYYAE